MNLLRKGDLYDEPIEVFISGLVIGGCIATAFIFIIWGVS